MFLRKTFYTTFYTAFILSAFILSAATVNAADAPGPSADPVPTEISVVGDAPFAAPPDRVTVSVRFDQTAATAEEASTQLDSRGDALSQKLKSICADGTVRPRGDRYGSNTPGPLQLKGGAPVTVQRTLALECSAPAKAGKIVDTALSAGGTVVTGVEFQAAGELRPTLDAIQLATKRAQEKAALTAGTLGVKLGALLSAVVTEEPEGESVRNQLQQGGDALSYGDRVQHLYVAVRYAIAR